MKPSWMISWSWGKTGQWNLKWKFLFLSSFFKILSLSPFFPSSNQLAAEKMSLEDEIERCRVLISSATRRSHTALVLPRLWYILFLTTYVDVFQVPHSSLLATRNVYFNVLFIAGRGFFGGARCWLKNWLEIMTTHPPLVLLHQLSLMESSRDQSSHGLYKELADAKALLNKLDEALHR